jgi:hypothetical protein
MEKWEWICKSATQGNDINSTFMLAILNTYVFLFIFQHFIINNLFLGQKSLLKHEMAPSPKINEARIICLLISKAMVVFALKTS